MKSLIVSEGTFLIEVGRNILTEGNDEGMKRRTLLASVAASTAAIAGCVSGSSESDEEMQNDPPESGDSAGENTADDHGTAGNSPDIPEPTGECGPATAKLSNFLTGELGPEYDSSQRTLDIRIENERDSSLAADVRIEHGESTLWESGFDIGPGEHVDESPDISADRLDSVFVTLSDGNKFTDSWSGDSCRLHGVAVAPDGIDAGYLQPVDGSVDSNWACYPKRENEFRVVNSTEESQTGTATVVDHCAETTVTESTMELRRGEHETVTESLLTGGRYTVAVDVENGPGATSEYGEDCGRFRASVNEDEIHFNNMIY